MLTGTDYLLQLRGDRIQREASARKAQRENGIYDGHADDGRLRVKLVDSSVLYIRPQDAITTGSLRIGQAIAVNQNGQQTFIDAKQRGARGKRV